MPSYSAITRVLGYYNGLLFQEEISDMEYEEYLHELAEKLHKLQEEIRGQVESEKVCHGRRCSRGSTADAGF
jgi:hypothetical protein